MKARLPLFLLLVGCGATASRQSADPDTVIGGPIAAPSQIAADAAAPGLSDSGLVTTPASTAQGSQAAGSSTSIDYTVNVLTSGDGPVALDIGPFHGVSASSPLKHVFTEGDEGREDRVALLHDIKNAQGDELRFEFTYLAGAETFELVERGYLELVTNGASLLAVTGKVAVEVLDRERLRVRFTGITLTPERAGAAPAPADLIPADLVPLNDGMIEGTVMRLCIATLVKPPTLTETSTSSPQQAVDATWTTEFCAQYAESRP